MSQALRGKIGYIGNMLIGENKVVTLSYQLFSLGESGTQEPGFIEERTVDDPVEFLYGQGQLLSAVEKKIVGQSAGYQANISLHPRDAFGLYNEGLVQWYDKEKMPTNEALQIGMKFQTHGPDGQVLAVMVKDIQGDKVLLDGNHPLAGLHVRFDLKILRVREATSEEIASKTVKQIYH